MATWFKSRRLPVEVPRLTPRSERPPAERVALAELTPPLLPFLGQAAYVQLAAFQSLARIIYELPDLDAKEEIATASGLTLAKFQSLAAEIRRQDADPTVVMEPFVATIDTLRETTRGADWQEDMLGIHVATGLLTDFFIRLATGLPGDVGPRVGGLLGSDSGGDAISRILQQQLADDAVLESRLAMWGRRLVGDTLLVARSALAASEDPHSDEQQIEPVFADVIAAHTRRMDALGLTA